MSKAVLLADDEHTFRETLAAFLRDEGISVNAVSNGADAIQAITEQPYPVAILDIRMPGADGISVLRETMRISPETRVIMITACGTAQIAEEAVNLGACDYLAKPLKFEDLLTKVKRHLRHRKIESLGINIDKPGRKKQPGR